MHSSQPYVPSLGRMASPGWPSSPNRYTAASNDPVDVGIGGAVDEAPDAWVGVPDTQRQLYAPYLHTVNAGSRRGTQFLQFAAGFDPLNVAGEGITGRDISNCQIPAWQRGADVVATILLFGECPKLNLAKGAPRIARWVEEGGVVASSVADRSLTYTDAAGNAVRYSNGYPDFSRYLYAGADGEAVVRIELAQSGSNSLRSARDEAAANLAAGFKETPDGFTWHHNEDRGLMQLVERAIHKRFFHYGGFSGK